VSAGRAEPQTLWATSVEFGPTEERRDDFGRAVGAFAKMYHRHSPEDGLVAFVRAALEEVGLVVLEVGDTNVVDPARLSPDELRVVDCVGHFVGTWHTYRDDPDGE
jgi:hypothetical protein